LKQYLAHEGVTRSFAKNLAKTLKAGDVITLSGPLGAGKSFFARALMRELGVKDTVMPSPSYAIIQEYEISAEETCSYHVAHMDWYRLQDAEEVDTLGVRDYFNNHWISFIEWPEVAPALIPKHAINISLQHDTTQPDARILSIDHP